MNFVVDVIIEAANIVVGFILHRDPRTAFERHLEVAVERSALERGGRQRQRTKVVLLAPPLSEKVADRRFDTWFGLPVPVHAKDGIAPNERIGGCDRDPDMLDDAGSGNGGDFFRFPGGDRDVIGIPSRPVIAGYTLRADILLQMNDVMQRSLHGKHSFG